MRGNVKMRTVTDPCLVLIHGMWVTPSCWDRIAAGMGADGCDVMTPALYRHEDRKHLLA